jgi:hypothetical protein
MAHKSRLLGMEGYSLIPLSRHVFILHILGAGQMRSAIADGLKGLGWAINPGSKALLIS